MKTSSLKVDNLRHIHDHGLAVEFTEPKLVALLSYLRGKQGITELKAGQSTLKVTTLGNVTKTEAFFSVGSNYLKSLHYFEAATGLKYTVKRDNADGSAEAFLTLNAVIFGGELPEIWTVNSGAQADKLRDWLNKRRWTVTGQNGLRAQAISARLTQLDQIRASAFSVHAPAAARFRKYATEATPEFFRERHGEARAKLAAQLANVEKQISDCQSDQADAEKLVAENEAKSLWDHNWAYSLGLSRDYVTHFPAVGAQFSHPIQAANYSATVSPSGAVFLSSGIQSEFTAPPVLAWLKGETQAPHSNRYGTLQRLEVSTRDGAPLVLLKCGCHYVDASNVSQEFAELLLPAHTVTLTPGRPRADFGTPEFAQRLAERFAERFADQDKERAQAIRDFANRRAYLEKAETDLPATIADLGAKADAAKASLDAAEKALADAKTVSYLGADADTLADLIRVFLTSQSFHSVLSK